MLREVQEHSFKINMLFDIHKDMMQRDFLPSFSSSLTPQRFTLNLARYGALAALSQQTQSKTYYLHLVI